MSAPPSPPTAVPRLSARREVGLGLLVAALTVATLLPFILLDRPPADPRLTFLGTRDEVSLLIEGAGGGRVLIGGGSAQSELPSALGRHFRPWDGALDLIIVADRRDLPGAIELVRRGAARAVATVGLDGERAAVAALAALWEACIARGIICRPIAAPERIAIGRAGRATLDVVPPGDDGEGARLRLHAGALSAAIIAGPAAAPGPALGAILLRGGQDPYRAALAADARLIVAPAPPTLPDAAFPAGAQLLLVARGERATLAVAGERLRLRDGVLAPLDVAAGRR